MGYLCRKEINEEEGIVEEVNITNHPASILHLPGLQMESL